jgi:hypothetical protein
MRFYALAQRPWIEEDGGGYWGLPPGTIGSVDLSAVGARNRVFVTSDQPFTSGGDILATFGSGARLDQLTLTGRERNNWNSLLGVSVPNGTTLLDALWDVLIIHADPNGAARARPIMPTRRGVLELHLGGHSLLRAEKLPENPTLHPAWPNIQAVKHRTCRKIYQHDETLARKWLGNEQTRFRLTDEAATELLVPDDLPRLSPIRPTTTITDNFNRANSTSLGTSSEGWSWTSFRFGVQNDQAYQTGSATQGGNARAEIDLSSDDHYAEIVASGWGGSGAARTSVAARSDDADPVFNVVYYATEKRDPAIWGTDLRLLRTDTVLADADDGTSAPCTVRVEADGSNISAYVNGVLKIGPVTDTEITGWLRAGMRFRGLSTADDFEAADLLADEGDDLVRVLGEAVGTGEQRSRLVAITRQRSDEMGVGHASLRARSRSRWLVETHGIGEATQRPMALFRALGDDVAVSEAMVSIVEAIGAELVRVASEAVAATEAMARVLGLTRRRHEALGTAETVRSAREMVRLRSEAATVSEATASVIDAIIAAVVRVVSEVIAMAEMARRPRHRARSREEAVGLATAIVQVGGVLGAGPAAIADRARMMVRAARRLIDRAATRFNVPPARR